jgi:uncharacterized membrane protein YfcA
MLGAIFAVAALYASVGHGGASGYLAAAAFFGIPPSEMTQSALTLNLLVSSLSFYAFWKQGHFESGLFWPFAAGSIPFAFLGGSMRLPLKVYALLLAATLAVAAARLLVPLTDDDARRRPISIPIALGTGAGIGLLSGLVGVGGGIFLSPLMVLMRWADTKKTAAVSALFIFVNSAAGLAGHGLRAGLDVHGLAPLAAAAFAGGLLGSRVGAGWLQERGLRRALALVLVLAAVKLARVSFA